MKESKIFGARSGHGDFTQTSEVGNAYVNCSCWPVISVSSPKEEFIASESEASPAAWNKSDIHQHFCRFMMLEIVLTLSEM